MSLVHVSHCCRIHGCKYGDTDCPVVSGACSAEDLCEECWNDIRAGEPRTRGVISPEREAEIWRQAFFDLHANTNTANQDDLIEIVAKFTENEGEAIRLIRGH